MELVIELNLIQLILFLIIFCFICLLIYDNRNYKKRKSTKKFRSPYKINLNKIIKNKNYIINSKYKVPNYEDRDEKVYISKIENKNTDISFIKKIDEKYDFKEEENLSKILKTSNTNLNY